MPKRNNSGNHGILNAEPRVHQRGREIQAYGTVTHAFHLQLEEPVRLEMTEHRRRGHQSERGQRRESAADLRHAVKDAIAALARP